MNTLLPLVQSIHEIPLSCLPFLRDVEDIHIDREDQKENDLLMLLLDNHKE